AVERAERCLEAAAAGEGHRAFLLLGMAADTARGLGEVFAALGVALCRGVSGCCEKKQTQDGPEADHGADYAPEKESPASGGAFWMKRSLTAFRGSSGGSRRRSWPLPRSPPSARPRRRLGKRRPGSGRLSGSCPGLPGTWPA